jgi:hypothetical protein
MFAENLLQVAFVKSQPYNECVEKYKRVLSARNNDQSNKLESTYTRWHQIITSDVATQPSIDVG